MRLLQHKREARWFYRWLSLVYDRVNRLFWTESMRERALALARLDGPDPPGSVLDVGAGTGFTTEGIARHVPAAVITMLDQSPQQLAVAARKPGIAAARRLEGDAERLPFGDDAFDRYVSAGSIEYWPDPQRAIAEAYRVLAPGGRALIVGPLPPRNRLARALADLWMLFPERGDYALWFERAGFREIELVELAPEWHGGEGYGLAIAGTKPAPGPSPLALPAPAEDAERPLRGTEALRAAYRFVLGSLAGALFVPIAAALALRARLRGPR